MSKSIERYSPERFINDLEVIADIERLKEKFGQSFENLLVSDTLDEEGNQYVNLVQKGGGILGIALVGYTHVLETAGIRFLRLAGTSAGAINTALMTVIEDKKKAKSKKILAYLCDMDFFSFVDGHPFARWIIKNFVSNKAFEKQLLTWVKGIIFSLLGLLFLDILFIGLRNFYGWASAAALTTFILTGLNFLVITAITFYGTHLFRRLKVSGYGINKGKAFYEWMKARMEENEISTVTALVKRAAELPKLSVRPENGSSSTPLIGDVSFIASELVSQNKIQFPQMCDLFRVNPDEIHPAEFVRASMSIPIFFESHMITGIPCSHESIKKAWFNYFKIKDEKDIPETVRFVDGGMLSNFPVNIFYNPKVLEPRLPAFGIDLDDSDPNKDKGSTSYQWSLGEYIWRLFNTVRYYYDKDFLEKNEVFQKGIGKVPLFGHNWLNFFISEEDKLKMFRQGAKSAVDFLLAFNWPEYRALRTEMQDNFNKKNSPEPTPKL